MVIRCTKYLGIKVERCVDGAGRVCLAGVIWYPKGRKRLGYLYPWTYWI